MDKIKVGIVGCGSFGNYHLDTLLRRDDVEVVALVNGTEERLRQTGAKVPTARLYTDHRAMLEHEPELNAILVCVPPSRHGDIEIDAAERGVHMYVEKPLGLSMDRVRRIEACIRQSGVITSVGYQNRYNPILDRMRKALEGQHVGLAVGKFLGYLPGRDGWWIDKASSGGQIVEQTTHVFDAMRYLFGEAVSVYASGVRNMHEDRSHNIEDASSVTVTFACGVVANILSGCYFDWSHTPADVGLTVYADGVRLDYDWDKSLTVLHQHTSETYTDLGPYHPAALDAFIEAVKTGNRSLIRSDYSDGAKTLALTLAANRSLETGEVVLL